jgi:hypothetical protein
MKKVLIPLFTICFVLLFVSICHPSGFFKLGAAYNSNGIETMSIDLSQAVKFGQLGMDFDFELDREQTEDRLSDLSTKAGVEARYFYDQNWYAFLDFQYQGRKTEDFDIMRTLTGIGPGGQFKYYNARFDIKTGAYVNSNYPGIDYDRNVASITTIGANIPIFSALSLNGIGSFEADIENIENDDYRADADIALIIPLTEYVNLQAGLDYQWINQPAYNEPGNTRRWLIQFGTQW